MPILEASQVLPKGIHVPTVASLGPLLVNSKQPINVKLFITMPVTLSLRTSLAQGHWGVDIVFDVY